jgi:hypothetical protein
MPGTDKYRLYVGHRDAYYTLSGLALKPNKCVAAGQLTCQEMIQWVKSVGIAFLDHHLRGLAGAADWLASTNVVEAGNSLVPPVEVARAVRSPRYSASTRARTEAGADIVETLAG